MGFIKYQMLLWFLSQPVVLVVLVGLGAGKVPSISSLRLLSVIRTEDVRNGGCPIARESPQ